MSVREAESVVAQADSLWHNGQMYGVDEGDSATLAKAYETLGTIPLPFREGMGLGSSFAHACYHYGKLLRAKDDPVAAMQAFINATHSHTRDYHILGRVYSNMGSICHLAGEYQLSYDMFEKSADMFLRNGDTLNYYYGLNEMAFELAEQGKKEETVRQINNITTNCNDKFVHRKTTETKALLYRNIGLYDSVINEINILQKQYSLQPHEFVLKAYAFWFLGQPDSALFYAKCIMDLPNSADQDKYNMLYILLNGDSTLDTEEIKALSEQRADLEMDKLVPIHKKHAVAIELLEQDLNRKHKYIYFTLFSIISSILLYMLVSYTKKIHKERTKQQEVLRIFQKEQSTRTQSRQQEIEEICVAIRNDGDWQQTINWKDYEKLCGFIDKHVFFFAHRLKDKKVLNEKEIRLCILVLIGGFSDKQMANYLYYAEKSIRGIKRYTAQKLGTNSANLRQFLLQMLVSSTNH